jgi:hypothetical protein
MCAQWEANASTVVAMGGCDRLEKCGGCRSVGVVGWNMVKHVISVLVKEGGTKVFSE